MTVTVTNTSSSILHLGRIEIVGANPRDFSTTTAWGSALAAGAECTVSVAFMPKEIGARSSSLRSATTLGGVRRRSV